MTRVQVFCAVSLDGYIAGNNDDLSWLDGAEGNEADDPDTVNFPGFMENIGAMLMGRRTYDIVMGFGEWPYGETPVLVATSRALNNPPPGVSACSGEIRQLCRQAAEIAGNRNVYLDGGGLITQALDADCIDELILSVVPTLLGKGIPLYGGEQLQRFEAQFLGRQGITMQIRLKKAR